MALTAAAVVGCGSGHDARITGVVSLDDRPLAAGDVVYHGREGAPGYGAIQPDGRYAIATSGRPGLKAGEYTVTVVTLAPPKISEGGGMPSPGKHLTPVRYATVGTSDLNFTVIPGENKIDLELRSR